MSNYNTITIISLTLIFYLITWTLGKGKIISNLAHKRIWNVILAITFFGSGILGIFLAISLDSKLNISWYSDILWWHVELGIAMAAVSILHFAVHWKYYNLIIKNILNNEPKK